MAEDLRRYGKWLRDEAFRRVGDLYPDASLQDGSKAKVVGWLWARAVRSPNPAARGAIVPLVSSFVLSTKADKQVWLEPQINPEAGTYAFVVRTGGAAPDNAKRGTKSARGANFTCLLTETPRSSEYIKEEGAAGRLHAVLLAIVADSHGSRVYLAPPTETVGVPEEPHPSWRPTQPLPDNPRSFWTVPYGLTTFGHLFTSRQLVTLATFADLVSEVREAILGDAENVGLPSDTRRLVDGGAGPNAYADAITTYLAITISRLIHYNCAQCTWLPKDSAIAKGLPQQGIPMVWDFAEGNPFGSSSSEFFQCLKNIADCLDVAAATAPATVTQVAAQDVGPLSTRQSSAQTLRIMTTLVTLICLTSFMDGCAGCFFRFIRKKSVILQFQKLRN